MKGEDGRVKGEGEGEGEGLERGWRGEVRAGVRGEESGRLLLLVAPCDIPINMHNSILAAGRD